MASRDYEEFIGAFNARGVRYLVVGAHALALHAQPRATRDLGILVDPTTANARRILAALRDFFGGADLGYSARDIVDPGWVLQLGVAPVRIDLFPAIPGLKSFGAAWKNRVDARFGAVPALHRARGPGERESRGSPPPGSGGPAHSGTGAGGRFSGSA